MQADIDGRDKWHKFGYKFSQALTLALLSSLAAFSSHAGPCASHLKHPATEIYIASDPQSKILPSNKHSRVRLNADRALTILERSPRKEIYFQILDVAQQSALFDRTLSVLAELEIFHLQQEIANYENWLSYLMKSREDELSHKIFEGVHAVYLLREYSINLAFEPRRGFFWDNEAHQARKSMDLEIRDPDTNKVVAYKEVKQVFSYRNSLNALDSVISKAAFMRSVVGDDVELSAVIYVDSKVPVTNEDRYYLFVSLHDQTEANKERLLNSKPLGRPDLDSLIMVDLNLGYYTKIYLTDRKAPYAEALYNEGVYPLIP